MTANKASFDQIFVRTATVYTESLLRTLRYFLEHGGAPSKFIDDVCSVIDEDIFVQVARAYDSGDYTEMQELERRMFKRGSNELFRRRQAVGESYNHYEAMETWRERVHG